MADKKISQLTAASTLTGSEEMPLVQSSTTKKIAVKDFNKLITVSKTASAGEAVNLDSSTYANAQMIKLVGLEETVQQYTHYLMLQLVSTERYVSYLILQLVPLSILSLHLSLDKT